MNVSNNIAKCAFNAILKKVIVIIKTEAIEHV